MTYSRTKGQGQRSVSSKDRKYTNGWMDRWMEGIALPDSLTWLVNIDSEKVDNQYVSTEN